MKSTTYYVLLFTMMLLFTVGKHTVAATLSVNTSNVNSTCDNNLNLDEAIALGIGNFNRALTTAEKDRISGASFILSPIPPPCGGLGWTSTGGLGSNSSDNIVFSNDVGIIYGGVYLGTNDSVDGLKPNGQKVILEGYPNCTSCAGVLTSQAVSSSSVRNLIIRGFTGDGVRAIGPNGSIYEGLEIDSNGGNGIALVPYAQSNPRNVTIGGPNANQQNKITRNAATGIVIISNPGFDRGYSNILIKNNFIGTLDGSTDNGNAGNGIYLENTDGVTIGDTSGLTRNIISGNNNDGITMVGGYCVSTVIVWNYIGTGINSAQPLGNAVSGIALLAGAGDAAGIEGSGNQIGTATRGNVISANSYGIFIADPNTSNNIIQGNLIGTNSGGNTDLGNSLDGILVGGATYDNVIGGTGAGEGNLIAFNRNGIYSDGGIRNAFRRNRIFANDNLGIELAPVGPTPNDPGDSDTGPNNLQNYPVITYVRALSSSVNIEGTFNSAPNQTYSLEFFGNSSANPSGFGEGRNFLGAISVSTNSAGNATFNASIAVSSSSTANWVTATATDSSGNTSEFSAVRNICADVRLDPSSVLAPTTGASSSFFYYNSNGCAAPVVTDDSAWITVGSVLSGIVNYSVAANTGPPRDGLITVSYSNGSGGQSSVNFAVSQNNGCSYSIGPSSQNFDAAGGNGSLGVTPSNGACTWIAASNAPSWITVTGGASGTGAGTVNFSVAPNVSGSARSGTISAAGQNFVVNQSAASRRASFDFDGDNKSDISIFRPSLGQWWLSRSSLGVIAHTFGNSADKIAPADFTGDGKTDIAIFRPSSGEWFVLRSENSTFYSFPFGINGDVPVPGDYDADGKADAAVFRPSNSTWYIQRSTGGSASTAFGSAGDRPVPADYDGDGKTDIAIFRPANGQWWLNRSAAGVIAMTFGNAADRQVPGDYTGDGKADVALWRPLTGEWFILRSENSTYYSSQFGAQGDVPVAGDYDGDGKYDPAVFRPSVSTWYVQRSTSGLLIQGFGASTDLPVPAAFVP